MRKQWKLLIVLIAVFGLIAAACGDDDDDTASGEPTAAAEDDSAADDSAADDSAADDGEADAAADDAAADDAAADDDGADDDGEADAAADDAAADDAATDDGEADAAADDAAADDDGAADGAAADGGGQQDFCLEIPGADEATGSGDFNVGMTFDLLGRGDQSFNDAAACGLDKAVEVFGVSFTEVVPSDESARETNLQLQAENSDLVIGNGFSFDTAVVSVAPNFPDVNFAITDAAMMDFEADPPVPLVPNGAGMVFAEEQGSYLVGVAAALKTETGTIGFIGGVSGIGLIERFEAGYIAGAKSVNPDIEVLSTYITEFPDFAGFESPDRGKEIALAMYDEGADIVYAAAGLSGSGMFAAAKEVSDNTGSKVWGIGVDSDQYLTVDPSQQEYVLTSMLKRVDVAVFRIIEAQANGEFAPGSIVYDLSVGGVDYSTSGGFVDDIVDELEAAREAIISGEVVVPTDPGEA